MDFSIFIDMIKETYYSDAPEIRDIAAKAFPGYSGKKFRVETFNGPMELRSYWDGGSRDYYVIVNMKNGRAKAVPENGAHGNIFRISKLPDSFAIVKHTTFSGKDMGITIYVNPENMSKMLPKQDDTEWAEKVVLSATRALKSSYAGIKDYRFHTALRDTGITKPEWDKAKEALIQKGMLNKAGAITDAGRNAIGRTDLYQLKRGKELDNSAETDIVST